MLPIILAPVATKWYGWTGDAIRGSGFYVGKKVFQSVINLQSIGKVHNKVHYQGAQG